MVVVMMMMMMMMMSKHDTRRLPLLTIIDHSSWRKHQRHLREQQRLQPREIACCQRQRSQTGIE
jgi:hypothetical protein